MNRLHHWLFPRPFWIAVFEIVSLTAGSMIVMASVYPDLLVHHQIRFTGGHEAEFLYEAAFSLANQFLNGGLQLWNRFDQLNYSWAHISLGFYTLPAVMEGWIYAQFYPWLDRPAEAFQAFHSLFYFSFLTFIRTIGGYALLSLFTDSRATRWLTLIIFNTLLAVHIYSELVISFILCLAPLLLYYIFRFFDDINGKNFLLVLVVSTLIFANTPVLALGYFYQGIHFVLFVCLIGLAAKKWAPGIGEFNFPNIFELIAKYSANPNALNDKIINIRRPRFERFKIPDVIFSIRITTLFWAGVAGALLLPILMVNVALLRVTLNTFFIAGSGLGNTTGRLDNILNPVAYFFSGYDDRVSFFKMFSSALNYDNNVWFLPITFLGSVVISLSIFGLLFNNRRWRCSVAAIIFLLITLHFPRSIISVGFPAHAINAVTNPFAFLVNSMNMTTYLLPYLLLAPIAMGIDSLCELGNSPSYFRRRTAAALLFFVLAVIAFVALPTGPAYFAGGTFVCSATIIWIAKWLPSRTNRRVILQGTMIAISVFTIVDLTNLSRYLNHVPYNGDRIQPRQFSGLESLGPVVIDLQNPKLMFLPRFILSRDMPSSPNTDPGWGTEIAEYMNIKGFPGSFYHTVFLSRHFSGLTIYEQRPIPYLTAPEDDDLQAHLRNNSSYIYHADIALNGNEYNLQDLMAANLNNRGVILERLPRNSSIKTTKLPARFADEPDQKETTRLTLNFQLRDATVRDRGDFSEYSFRLPKIFPSYMATEILIPDRDQIRLTVDGKSFAPAQGRLIRPSTFDVNNVASDHLVVALPRDVKPNSQIVLEATRDPLIRDVWRNEHDNFGVDYVAPSDGWMVLRSHYEEGWAATVNGDFAPIFKANITSTAIPVKKGTNKILLQYKSENLSRLRDGIKAMIVFMLVGFGFVFWHAIRETSNSGDSIEENNENNR